MTITRSAGNGRNVGEGERWVSLGSGAVLTLYGLSRGNFGGFLLALLGGGLIYRGASGNCQLYRALGVSTASGASSQPVTVQHAVTINKPVEKVYRFWRDFENLPRFMQHLESVKVYDQERSHWIAKAPAGGKVEWDAEIIDEQENERIAWRSIAPADIDNSGVVRFAPAPEGRGTTVSVELTYAPPAGKVGAALLKLTGEEPDNQVKEDLRLFKQVMEAGEIATTVGQPDGRR
ncbi:SRPBCC family protein [Gloeobacter kilaueensis]|uniref:Cyclase/dehydrase n=1 Tax=Gloeobacter kilaueensis (strain ATCC BAA-2537 / CCAP 1431/1 / ULC 316 / JS1) TaxID=1183438 RepID=U5QIN0_GLOK1|nr:SRPBCC family protein [Gloeobacter kilaueensis]AGY58791.1 cyclase/dehydrase [Gloeobacter kilaueensis JS1]